MKELEESGHIFIGRTQPFDAGRELMNGNLRHVNDVTHSTMVVSHQDIKGTDAPLPELWVLAPDILEECFLDELGRGGRLPEPVREGGVLAAVGRLQTSRAHAEVFKELLQRPLHRLLPLAHLLFGGLRFRPQFAAHFDGDFLSSRAS